MYSIINFIKIYFFLNAIEIYDIDSVKLYNLEFC